MKQSVKFIVGNWKMNGDVDGREQFDQLNSALAETPSPHRVAICPPATLIAQLAWAARGCAIELGGQDCHGQASGAYTGCVSAELLKAAGASLVILGHSERRADFGESDLDVSVKVEAALRAGLEPIVCVGETLDQREAGQCLPVVTEQIRGSLPRTLAGKAFAVAYEPVWAIGTGLTPTLEQIEEVHGVIRAALVERFGEAGGAVPILYGGSVKPSNAAEILAVPEVGGALVGGASLKAADFLEIIRAAA